MGYDTLVCHIPSLAVIIMVGLKKYNLSHKSLVFINNFFDESSKKIIPQEDLQKHILVSDEDLKLIIHELVDSNCISTLNTGEIVSHKNTVKYLETKYFLNKRNEFLYNKVLPVSKDFLLVIVSFLTIYFSFSDKSYTDNNYDKTIQEIELLKSSLQLEIEELKLTVQEIHKTQEQQDNNLDSSLKKSQP